MDDALLGGDEDAVAAVAGVGQHERPQGDGLALVGDGFPAGPLQVGEGDGGFQRQGALVHFPTGDGGGENGHGPRLRVGHQDRFAVGAKTQTGRGLEAGADKHRLLARPGNDQHPSGPVADEEPAVLVPDQAAAAEAVGKLVRAAVRESHAQELPRDGIDRQQMREAVQHDAVGRFQGRRAFAVGDESNLALGIDAIDRAAFLVGDVQRSRFIDIDVVQRYEPGE